MKIAFLTDGIYPYVLGGMQRHSTNLIKHLALNGFEITLFHCVYDDSKLPIENEVNSQLFENQSTVNVRVVGIKFPKSNSFPGHYLFNSRKYSILVYQELLRLNIYSFDFIYCKGFSGWKLIIEKKKLPKIPTIGLNFHGYEMWQDSAGMKSKLIQLFFRPFVKWQSINSDFVFSYGGKINNILEKIGVSKDRIIELPSAIEKKCIRVSKITTSDVIKFLFVGRYERRKAVEEINDSVLSLNKQGINFEFHFIGPIPSSKKVNANNVIYHGTLTNNEEIFSVTDTCDVLLCPSFSEGMPNVILEAMSRGLAVIASDVGAVSLLVSSDNGVLLEKNNSASISDALIYFSNLGKDELVELKKKSIEKIQDNFTWNVVVKDFSNKISRICQG